MRSGTKCKLSTECGLVRGNSQFPEISDLSSQPKISRANFLVDLKVQDTTSGKIAQLGGL
jgi:hypothetical protein